MKRPSVPISVPMGGISHFLSRFGNAGWRCEPNVAPQNATDRELLTMSYRRGRSYGRADRRYRSHEQRPRRARPALMIGLLMVVLAAGMAAVTMPRVRTVLDASVSAAAPASHCRDSAAAGSATWASAPAEAGA